MDAVKASFDGLSFRGLVMWERPTATGIVVALDLAFLFLVGYINYTIVTLLCRIFQLAIALMFVGSLTGRLPTTEDRQVERKVEAAFAAVQPVVAQALSSAYEVIAWTDAKKTFAVLLASTVVAFMGTCLSDLTMLFIASIVFFVVPVAYTHNKDLVDPHLQKVKQALEQLINQIPALGKSKPGEQQQKKQQ